MTIAWRVKLEAKARLASDALSRPHRRRESDRASERAAQDDNERIRRTRPSDRASQHPAGLVVTRSSPLCQTHPQLLFENL